MIDRPLEGPAEDELRLTPWRDITLPAHRATPCLRRRCAAAKAWSRFSAPGLQAHTDPDFFYGYVLKLHASVGGGGRKAV